jgi:hypothetical protein
MSKLTVYEWVFEDCDEFDDIHDVNHFDTLEGSRRGPQDLREALGVGGLDLALQKNVYDELGELLVKAYAYVDLTTHEIDGVFDEGGGMTCGKVPNRYRRELAAWFASEVSK